MQHFKLWLYFRAFCAPFKTWIYYLSIHACALGHKKKFRSANKEITRNYQQISPLAHVHKLMCSWTKKICPTNREGAGPKICARHQVSCSPGHWSPARCRRRPAECSYDPKQNDFSQIIHSTFTLMKIEQTRSRKEKEKKKRKWKWQGKSRNEISFFQN